MTRLVSESRQSILTLPTPQSSLYFGSGNAIVTASNNNALKNLTQLTVEAWINCGVVPANLNRICEYGASSNKGWNFLLNASSGVPILQVNIGNGTTTGNLQVGTVLRSAFSHVATTWDGTTIRMFVNGTLQGTTAALSGGNTGDPASSFYIGNRSAGDRGFIGLIQELRVSNVARYTASFTPQTSQFETDASTVGLWHFDENTSTVLTDSSGNGITGTLSGSPLPQWSAGRVTKVQSYVRTEAGTRLLA